MINQGTSRLRRHRPLKLELRLEDHLVDLVGEGVDGVVRACAPPPDSKDVIAQSLDRFRRVAVAAPAYLARRGTPRCPADLARHECLVQLGPSLRPTWRFGAETVEPAGALTLNNPTALLGAVIAGLGVALLPDWLVAADVAAGRLRRLLPSWETPETTVWAVYRIELSGVPRVRILVDSVHNPKDGP